MTYCWRRLLSCAGAGATTDTRAAAASPCREPDKFRLVPSSTAGQIYHTHSLRRLRLLAAREQRKHLEEKLSSARRRRRRRRLLAVWSRKHSAPLLLTAASRGPSENGDNNYCSVLSVPTASQLFNIIAPARRAIAFYLNRRPSAGVGASLHSRPSKLCGGGGGGGCRLVVVVVAHKFIGVGGQ